MKTKNISSYVSTSRIREELSCVLVKPDGIVATDSFRLIKETGITGVEKPVLMRLPKGVKTFDRASADGSRIFTKDGAAYQTELLDADLYPDIERVWPTGEPMLTIRVNPKYLKEALASLADQDRVTATLFGAFQPIVLSADNREVLVMPLNG